MLLILAAGDVRQAVSKTSNHRLSLVVVCVITTSCCIVTALLTLAVVIVVIRHRRRHHATSSRHRNEKSATASPLITSLRPAAVPTSCDHHQSAPRLLPDLTRCYSDRDEHQYDVLETRSACYWPGSGGSMTVDGRLVTVNDSNCPCSSCVLVSSTYGDSRPRSAVTRHPITDRC